MKKILINIPEGLGDVLSQEELKHVLGGMGSYGSLGSMGSTEAAKETPPKVKACEDKQSGEPCSWLSDGTIYNGTCQNFAGLLYCSSLPSRPFKP